MKASKRYRVKPGKIHSMDDLRMEKLRLKMEIMKTEENIHTGYRNILEALSLKNLVGTLVNDVGTTSSVMAKAFTYGQSILGRRKKKKHDKEAEPADTTRS